MNDTLVVLHYVRGDPESKVICFGGFWLHWQSSFTFKDDLTGRTWQSGVSDTKSCRRLGYNLKNISGLNLAVAESSQTKFKP